MLRKKKCPSCEKRFRRTGKMLMHVWLAHESEFKDRVNAAIKAFTDRAGKVDPAKDMPADLEWAARARCDHLTTLATLTSYSSATARHVSPLATNPTTRSRRSSEYARAIHAGLRLQQEA